MHLFKSQLLQEADRRSIGSYDERGFGSRYGRRRMPNRAFDRHVVAARNDDLGVIEAAREMLRRMADYDQAA